MNSVTRSIIIKTQILNKILNTAHPDGNCNAFRFHPSLHNESDKRKISISLEPIAITVVAGVPYTKIPFNLRSPVSMYRVVSIIALVLATYPFSP